MLTNIHTCKTVGLEAVGVNVEVNITPGIGIHLIGLADVAVKESLLRTVTALQSTGYRIPGEKIIINLAPADLVKSGTGYDLPIAVGLIAASSQEELPGAGKYIILGELGLDGKIRAIQGAFPAAELAAALPEMEGIILPEESAKEVTGIMNKKVYAVKTLAETIDILKEETDVTELLAVNRIGVKNPIRENESMNIPDFSDIPGQNGAKRAMEIAAAGGHHVVMMGAPGSGKNTLAKALLGILPPMTEEQCREVSRIYSVSGRLRGQSPVRMRPFRSPHFSSSLTALLGGGCGDNILPGEVSLAHNGVLYIDQAGDWPKVIREALRVPIEDGHVKISRLKSVVTYPTRFQMVIGMEPCPCGYYGEGDRCRCTPTQRRLYLEKTISHPLMDRVDIQVWTHSADNQSGKELPKGETSAEIAGRVAKARAIQAERFKDEDIRCNAEMLSRHIEKYCQLDADTTDLVEKLITHMGLSARAFTRMMKIARTIADLDGSDIIKGCHLAEAASYRFLDRMNLFDDDGHAKEIDKIA